MRLDGSVVYEGLGRRVLCGVIDLVLAAIVAGSLMLLGFVTGASVPDASRLAGPAGWSLAMTVSAQTLCWTFLRGTPGMLLMGCQVLDARTGARLALARSLARAVALWVGLACLGVGVLWIIRDTRHRGLHDLLAGSVVVREDESLLTLDELAGGAK